ncbi:MAG: hypothetical protein WB780_16650 [Candidatus Acidiferrales bacterium]
MRHFVLAGPFFAASVCWAQDPTPNIQQPPPQAQPQAPTAAPKQTITIPAGTLIPMTLVSPITDKTSKPGNPVRAATAAPVTVDNQVAIPAGTYVEGVIDRLNMRGPTGPSLQVHFTRILFNNGYTVTIDATNAVAQVIIPSKGSPEDAEFASEDLPGHTPFVSGTALAYSHALAAQQGPTPPPLPPLHNPGPSFGTVVGIGLGVAAAAIVGLIIVTHHGSATTNVLFDTGWQFQMALQSPLTLDAARVAAAVATENAQ